MIDDPCRVSITKLSSATHVHFLHYGGNLVNAANWNDTVHESSVNWRYRDWKFLLRLIIETHGGLRIVK